MGPVPWAAIDSDSAAASPALGSFDRQDFGASNGNSRCPTGTLNLVHVRAWVSDFFTE